MTAYTSETWEAAVKRVPTLAEYNGRFLDGEGLARVCTMVDTLPGAELFQIFHQSPRPCVFLFRERKTVAE